MTPFQRMHAYAHFFSKPNRAMLKQFKEACEWLGTSESTEALDVLDEEMNEIMGNFHSIRNSISSKNQQQLILLQILYAVGYGHTRLRADGQRYLYEKINAVDIQRELFTEYLLEEPEEEVFDEADVLYEPETSYEAEQKYDQYEHYALIESWIVAVVQKEPLNTSLSQLNKSIPEFNPELVSNILRFPQKVIINIDDRITAASIERVKNLVIVLLNKDKKVADKSPLIVVNVDPKINSDITGFIKIMSKLTRGKGLEFNLPASPKTTDTTAVSKLVSVGETMQYKKRKQLDAEQEAETSAKKPCLADNELKKQAVVFKDEKHKNVRFS